MSDALGSDMAERFAERLFLIDDSLACVATIHLSVEYWINRLLNEQAQSAVALLGEAHAYGVNVKLAVLANMNVLPESLCRNIQKLNELKDLCAKDLNVDFTRMALDYVDPDGNVKLEDLRDRLISGDEETIKAVLRWVGLFTFGWLSRHCIEELGMQA
jgi:hypothetical protein